MKRPSRLGSAAAVFVIVLLAFINARQRWSERATRFTIQPTIGSQHRQLFPLKEIIVQDLIEGRITLATATAQFQELHECSPKIASFVRIQFPAPTAAESTALNVLRFAENRLQAQAERRQEVHCRLELELAKLRELPVNAEDRPH